MQLIRLTPTKKSFSIVNFRHIVTKAFTLAEVLIVLVVIGVIAAMTIPALINNTNNQETIAKVKKAYSTISAAYERAVADNGSPEGWGWNGTSSGDGAINVLNILGPYLNITKNCGTSTGCFPDVVYNFLNNTTDGNLNTDDTFAKAQLADGALITISTRSTDCTDKRGTSLALQNNCGIISYDVNGLNPPNQMGKDLFNFYVTKYGVVPVGTSAETAYLPSNCDKNAAGYAGSACAAWILQKGNMDYLK